MFKKISPVLEEKLFSASCDLRNKALGPNLMMSVSTVDSTGTYENKKKSHTTCWETLNSLHSSKIKRTTFHGAGRK
jgi:hypothetical protein